MVSPLRRMPQAQALPASGEISEHHGMGFMDVRRRNPYFPGQPRYGVKAIIDEDFTRVHLAWQISLAL